ncbi:MAG TPA: cytochrome c oxidase assembly protein [Candidatus Limnocylindrales bacterium]
MTLRRLAAAAAGAALASVPGAVGWLALAGPVAAHGPFDPTPPSAWILATGWVFDPTVAIPLAAVAVGWLWLVDRIGSRHPRSPVPVRRTVAFLLGLLAVAVALQSGIERYDTALFSIHMVQHLLLTLVAPPLLLLGAPITQLLRVASPDFRRRVLLPLLHSAPVAFVSHPVTAWILFTGVMWGSHFSPLFDLSLENPPVHQLEHVLYLSTALLFWLPVIGLDPAPRRLGFPARIMYLLTQMPPSSFLAMSILFAGAPLYHHYATEGSPYGIDALADQQAAAGIMWIASDVVFIGAILLVVAAWMRHEERRTLETEARVDQERVALAARADRLAAARAQPGSGEASSSR